MKLTAFEKSLVFGVFMAWVQLMCGYTEHAFFVIAVLMLICLVGIMEYTRM